MAIRRDIRDRDTCLPATCGIHAADRVSARGINHTFYLRAFAGAFFPWSTIVVGRGIDAIPAMKVAFWLPVVPIRICPESPVNAAVGHVDVVGTRSQVLTGAKPEAPESSRCRCPSAERSCRCQRFCHRLCWTAVP